MRPPRWELVLLGLAIAHWAYHKNREWNELVTELLHSSPYPDDALDLLLDAVPAAAAPPCRIDLTFPAQASHGAS